MVYHDAAIRSLIERVGVANVRDLCQQPGMQAVYRITVYAVSGRIRHSIATLLVSAQRHKLEVVYDGLFEHQPLQYSINIAEYDAFVTTLRKARFDVLHDQANLLLSSDSIWQIERAAGSLHHQVILAPSKPEKPYSLLVNAIDAYLPQAIREITY